LAARKRREPSADSNGEIDEVLGWIPIHAMNQEISDGLRNAADDVVRLIKFIRAVSSDPGENLNLQASTGSMHQLNQDLRNLLEVTTKIMENIREFFDFHCLASGIQAANKFWSALINIHEVTPRLLLVDDPPPAPGRPKAVARWHIYVELLADWVEAVLKEAGYKQVSRTNRNGPFARMMHQALEKIEGRSPMRGPAAIAAYLDRPVERRIRAMVRAAPLRHRFRRWPEDGKAATEK
jgi:hypothetical protein